MKILGIDYGDVRTGVAVSDDSQFLASAVCVIKETYQPKLIEKIAEIVSQTSVQVIVVGLPKNMDGTEGFRAEKCREFASLLTDRTGLETVLIDERLTTVEAHKILSATNTRGKKRKEVVDAVSAVMILQDYLDRNRKKK